jgi:hypothetical protein
MLDELESLSDQSYDKWDVIGGNSFALFIVALVASVALGLLRIWFWFGLLAVPCVIISAGLAAVSLVVPREEDNTLERDSAGEYAASRELQDASKTKNARRPNHPLRFRHP